MSEKKHIDRIFQESFKDFEATPSDAVWTSIETKLKEKKKKRRIIPIWWRYAGVAALLLLFLSIGGVYFNNSGPQLKNQIVDIEDNLLEGLTNASNDSSNQANETDDNNIANGNDVLEPKSESSLSQSKPTVIASSNSEIIVETLISKSSNESKSGSTEKDLFEQSFASENSADKNNNIVANNIGQTNDLNASEKTQIDQEIQKQLDEETYKSSIALVESEKETQESKLENKANAKSTLSIEEALDKNKDIIQGNNNPENRWSVAPNIAPVYFNTLNEGSSLDGQFNSNSKTGDVNMSYGISTSYALNKKLKIRSGINKVNLGYNTNDVVVFQSTGRSSSAMKNVNGTGGEQALESNNNSTAVVSTNSSINQSFGYIEVPLEIQYTFVDKRLGVNFIGGFSSLFLDSNEIYSERDNGIKTYLGEANNINDVSYSANLGLGLNYKFSKKIDLNLEPTFKYQLNTFNNTSGDFTPYFIGVYTGFAIKF